MATIVRRVACAAKRRCDPIFTLPLAVRLRAIDAKNRMADYRFRRLLSVDASTTTTIIFRDIT
jgi:hypothetical protein